MTHKTWDEASLLNGFLYSSLFLLYASAALIGFFFFNFLKPRSSPLSFTSAASIFWWPQLTFIILPPISFSCFRWRLKCYSLSGHSQSTQNLTFKLTAPAALVHVTHQNTNSCLVGYKYILLSNIRIFSQAYTSRLGTVSLFYLALCA